MASPDAEAIQEAFTNETYDTAMNSFVDSQQLYFPDLNSGSYSSGIIRFDTLASREQFVIWADSYLQIPLTIGSSSGTAYTAFDPITWKNSILDLITSVQINSGSGQTIVNDNSTQYINNLRLLLDTSFDAAIGNMADLHYWINSLPVNPQGGTTSGSWGAGAVTSTTYNYPWALGPANNGSAALNTQNALNVNYNAGMSKRIQFFKSNATFAAGQFQLLCNIPLRFIHPFFAALNFPLLNCHFQFNFGTSVIAPSTTPAATSTTNKMFIVGPTDANPAGANLPDVFASIAGVQNQCRIYYRKVVYSAPLNQKIQTLLQRGFKKVVEYCVTDVYNSIIPANDTSTNSRTVLVSSSTVAPQRVWVLPLPTGENSSITIPFLCPGIGGTASNNAISNANVLINNTPYYYNQLIAPMDFYLILKENMISHGYSQSIGSQINFKEFTDLHNYVLFDVHRLKDRLSSPNDACTIQVTFQRQNGFGADFLVLVERTQVAVLDISSSGVSIAVGSAA